MSDKEDREWAKNTLKTAKKGSAARIEAMGILSGDDPEKREYRKTTRENKNKLKGSKDNIGMMGGGYMKKNMMGGGYMKKNMMGGGSLSPKQKDIAQMSGNPNKIETTDFTALRNKKYGGKINYRMSGGKVVDSSYE